MLDDLAFDARSAHPGTLPPDAPLAMPTQVIERRGARVAARRRMGRGWLRRLLLSAG